MAKYVAFVLTGFGSKIVDDALMVLAYNENARMRNMIASRVSMEETLVNVFNGTSAKDIRQRICMDFENKMIEEFDAMGDEKYIIENGISLYAITDGPMAGECEQCKECIHCKNGRCDIMESDTLLYMNEIRHEDCPFFESPRTTGFYLNFEEENEIYLGNDPEDVARTLENEYDESAEEALREFLDDRFDKDELIDMIVEGNTYDVEDMTTDMEYDERSVARFGIEGDMRSGPEYGSLRYIYVKDKAFIESTAPTLNCYYYYERRCKAKNIEPVPYNELLGEGVWRHPGAIADMTENICDEWFINYLELRPEVMKTLD